MEEEKKDVNAEEKSAEESSSEDSSESSADKQEDKSIPYARFKEVNDQKKQLEERLVSLETKKADGKSLTPEEKKELDAKTYLKNLLKETLDEEQKAKADAEKQEEVKFNREVSEILDLNPDVKKDDFLKFVEEKADKYGISSVSGAVLLYKELNASTKEAKEAAKRELNSRPNFPNNEGGSEAKAVDVRNKSFSQLAEEAIQELESKK